MELLHNGILVNEGTACRGYVVIDGDKIARVGTGDPDDMLRQRCTTLTDVEGAIVMPGVIDDHVHFREPGLTHKADIASESRAAVAGGVTSYLDMPNVKPTTTTIETLNDKMARAAQCSMANYSFYMGATADNIDMLKTLDYTRVCGVKAFLGSSTGGMLIDDTRALGRLFAEVPALIAVHCEDEGIIAANRARLVAEHGDNLPVRYHQIIRSREACVESTRRAIALARETGARLHVLHISTADELALIGHDSNITAEACIGHLWFTSDDHSRLGYLIKVNPAIKNADDRVALRKAVADGRIGVVGTDHAPHLPGEKEGNCLTAASGMPMIQFSLAAMLEMANKGAWDVPTVVQRMCHTPATLYGIDRRGFLREGYYADIAVVKNETYTITNDCVLSKCAWTPLDGTTMHHRVAATYVNGKRVFHNGELSDTPAGMPLKFSANQQR
ncbi:MAG: dihydroorotase [Bacteroidales bacterium]|nr:dihydroorotase [Candidatus Sodaliphilus aphodohippi]